MEAIARRYPESGGERYGVTLQQFQQFVAAVVLRCGAQTGVGHRQELVAGLHVEELVLARACTAGHDAAWEVFLTRFRAPLYEAAYRIARDEATGRELADGLYAELYGIPNDRGKRISKLDYYMGRGSLEGWLRTVLAQRYVDRHRKHARDVSLEEQVEAGVSFAARPMASADAPDTRLADAVRQTLSELGPEERFLLAAYYLDQRTLADIGCQLRMHESTVSRKLERLTRELRKYVRRRLQAAGMAPRRCDELLQDLDVRDLQVDVAGSLRQETPAGAFYKKDGSVT